MKQTTRILFIVARIFQLYFVFVYIYVFKAIHIHLFHSIFSANLPTIYLNVICFLFDSDFSCRYKFALCLSDLVFLQRCQIGFLAHVSLFTCANKINWIFSCSDVISKYYQYQRQCVINQAIKGPCMVDVDWPGGSGFVPPGCCQWWPPWIQWAPDPAGWAGEEPEETAPGPAAPETTTVHTV